MTDLHTRYERLLFAYPRDYRRRRGAEIADTYTEMAAEGQRWPRGRDAVSLLRHGLRTRLGRPRGRLVVPLTVLAMLIGGLCAAAGGARAAWGASTGLSARQLAEARHLTAAHWMLGSATDHSRHGAPRWFAGYLSMPAWDIPVTVVMSSGTGAGGPAPTSPRPNIRELVAEQRAALVGTGWTVTNVAITGAGATMTVRNGDLLGHLAATPEGSGQVVYLAGPGDITQTVADATYVTFDGQTPATPPGFAALAYRTTPASVPVFMGLAGLLGAALTYLLIGWVNRRAGRLAAWPRRVITAGLALTAALAAPAAAVCGAGLWTALRHHGDMPIRYWGGFVTGDVRIAALAAAILLVATVAGAALGRPAPPAAEVAAQ